MASKNPKRPVTERRVFNLTECEVRSEGDGPVVFRGYAAVFNELSVNLGGFRERIKPGAFRTAIDDGDDVRFLINHDASSILGRTPKTLSLSEDERGLVVECELPDTSYARDLQESMRRGDINQMSFGFTTRADAWPAKDDESGLPIRELIDVGLFDVSAVTYPAYPDTEAALTEVRTMNEENTELMERAARAADELPEPEAREEEAEEPEEKPEDKTDADEAEEKPEDEEKAEDEEPDEERDVRAEFEQLRAEAGVRVEDDHEECDGVAVVWNFNDELQSCHADRAAAEAQVEAMTSGAAGAAREVKVTIKLDTEEFEKQLAELQARAGKVLSTDNEEKLTQAMTLLHGVMSAAGVTTAGSDIGGSDSTEANEHLPEDGETRETPDERAGVEAFLAGLEERGWSYDDDYEVWLLTQLIQLCSCYLLYEGGQGDTDDDQAEDDAEGSVVRQVMSQLTGLLDAAVAEAARTAEAEGSEERESEIARERRRLRLRELEASLA